jgi:hypothetical protein
VHRQLRKKLLPSRLRLMKRLSVVVALLIACAIGAVAVLLVSGRAESQTAPAPPDLRRP